MSETRKYLSVDRCPTHGFWAICISEGNGGKRLTPSKCCGSWQEVHRWKATPDMLASLRVGFGIEDQTEELNRLSSMIGQYQALLVQMQKVAIPDSHRRGT